MTNGINWGDWQEDLQKSIEQRENFFKSEEKLVGGEADGKTCEEIAKKHGVSVEKIKEQIELGVKEEAEHTSNRKEATEIAKDHIWKIVDYYTRLDKMEEEAEEGIEKASGRQVTLIDS